MDLNAPTIFDKYPNVNYKLILEGVYFTQNLGLIQVRMKLQLFCYKGNLASVDEYTYLFV